MYNKKDLIQNLSDIGFLPDDNLFIHSSMKSIGKVEGGADTVIDALIEFFGEYGNIALPSHSWSSMKDGRTFFDYENEPSCVGILTNIFRKRNGVIRSLHPTHSISIFGKDKILFTEGEHLMRTPCPRVGCWGKLMDMNFKIMFLGCGTECNTFLHGVEEWNDIPDRLTPVDYPYQIKLRDGSVYETSLKRHYNAKGNISDNYERIQPFLEEAGCVSKCKFGDAECVVENAVHIYEITTKKLLENPDFFGF